MNSPCGEAENFAQEDALESGNTLQPQVTLEHFRVEVSDENNSAWSSK